MAVENEPYGERLVRTYKDQIKAHQNVGDPPMCAICKVKNCPTWGAAVEAHERGVAVLSGDVTYRPGDFGPTGEDPTELVLSRLATLLDE